MAMPPPKKLLLGAEYDLPLQKALRKALRKLRARVLSKDWVVGGSQEVNTSIVEIDGQPITIETETYIGLSIMGDAATVDRIAAILASRRP